MTERLQGYIRRSGFLQGMAILLVLSAALMGWRWMQQVTVLRIQIRGYENATEQEIRTLVSIDSGAVMYEVDTILIKDRVIRHPWIEEVTVSRLPTGTLVVDVAERLPVVQTVDRDGRPGFYLDRVGVQLPPVDSTVYDVPLLTGYPEPYQAMHQTENRVVRDFLDEFVDSSDDPDRIISEISYRSGEIWLRLEPVGNHGSTPVRLGNSDFGDRLHRLDAFWNQAILHRQDTIFDLIDLRFSSQIVVRERSRGK